MAPQRSGSSPAGDGAPKILDVPIGLTATGTRRETDSMGAIDVPADRYWGAQTQRSLIHFSIGDDRMPKAVYHAYGYVKKAAAIVNGRAGGQEWSGYAHQLAQALDRVATSAEGLHELAAGGTAVGTGLNAPEGFGEQVAAEIATATGYPFRTAANKFAAQGSLDAMVGASAGLRALAVCLMKIANDIRWLASGPRCGLSELILPANEPGSSIMPGKVNPTQCEAMVMVCIQVLSDDAAIAFAGSQGNFELNATRPVIINNFLHAATILTDACTKLRQYCIEGTELNRGQIDSYVNRSLMLVTALSPVIGYDKASAIAHKANDEGTTRREAALATGYVSGADFDRIVDPSTMVGR